MSQNKVDCIASSDALLAKLAGLPQMIEQLESCVSPGLELDVEFDDGFNQPNEFGSTYVHYFANYRIVSSSEHVNDISARIRRSVADGSFGDHVDTFNYLVSMLVERISNLTAGVPYTVISLGADCLSRTIPTKWGRKKPRVLGELTMPFDLAIHPPASVADILESDFAGYLRLDKIQFDSCRNYPIHEQYGIQWNHEVGDEWHADGWNKFLEHYNRRIANFRAKLSNGIPIVAVMYSGGPFGIAETEIARRTAHAVARMSTSPIAFVCISSSRDSILASAKDKGRIDWIGENPLFLSHIPLPYDSYEWFDHRHFTRAVGLKFELAIVEVIDLAVRYLKGHVPLHRESLQYTNTSAKAQL
jgi:hypothetical protein